jgi:hypothetical protein
MWKGVWRVGWWDDGRGRSSEGTKAVGRVTGETLWCERELKDVRGGYGVVRGDEGE